MISKEKIDRINELSAKAKSDEGLSKEEKAEREQLRREYIDAMKENVEAQLKRVKIVDQNDDTKDNLEKEVKAKKNK